jgi:hypothetical protein
MNWNRHINRLESLMLEVLQASKKPMTLNEIVDVIKSSNPESFNGKTPRKSLYSIIYRNEKRRQENNESLLFKVEITSRHAIYSLNIARTKNK